MKKILLGLLLALPAFFVSTTASQALYMTSEQVVEIAADETIDDDVFLAGGTVFVRGTINGDLYAAGGTIEIDGTVTGDIIAAGGTILISGTVGQDIRAAGGTITISNTEIADGVSLAGGSLTIDGNSSVGGSFLAAGGTVNNRADVGRHFIVGAGTVSLNGNVGGDAEIGSGSLSIGPGVSIGGNLRYPETSESQIAETASISGTVEQFATDYDRPGFAGEADAAKAIWAANYAFQVWSFFAALLVGLLTLYLLPKTSLGMAETLRNAAPKSLLIGFITFMLAGPVLLMLFISMIGIPLALILTALYLVSMYMAKLVVGLSVGLALRDQFDLKNVGPYLALVIGLALYYLLGMIPVLGFFVSLLTIFAGLGAMYLWTWNWAKKRK